MTLKLLCVCIGRVQAVPSRLGKISSTKEMVADQHMTRQRTSKLIGHLCCPILVKKGASMGPKMAITQVFYQTQNLYQIFIDKKFSKYIATDKASLQLRRWTLTPCHDLNILPQKKHEGVSAFTT